MPTSTITQSTVCQNSCKHGVKQHIPNDEELTKVKFWHQNCDVKEVACLENCDRPSPDYYRVGHQQMHWNRKGELLEKHPELEKLFGPDINSFYWTIFLVVAQTFLAYIVGPVLQLGFVSSFIAAYLIGAIICHALWVLIHDATHDLVFHSKYLNCMVHLLMNIPHVFPSSMSFRYYHRKHHSNLNETYGDPDVPSLWEADLFGTTSVGKAIWLLFFPVIQTVRVVRYKSVGDFWTVANYVIQAVYTFTILYYWGYMSVFYLVVSSLFSIGFHPMGARWVAEHYAVHPEQETYSYYGIANQMAFNIGYHNEHHDLPKIAWSKLPEVTRIAPEFYRNLHFHDSYIALLWRFVSDPQFSLKTRVVRNSNRDLAKN